ncbi:hypothetical protein C0Q70_11170 [Pomacea canaliculata]|uniref:C2 domain-containing protein n=1 Tax=Pomacea canaliculata TaxID=400727 RepID=A0A2T7P578_POMCA|nr:hypothetical protein C0Q70_11170 [Pomacea canaliculata]
MVKDVKGHCACPAGAIRPDLYPRKDIVLQQASLDGAQDLPPPESVGAFSDPYVRISLVPSVDERVRQSSVKRRTINPYYNEYFKFPVAFEHLREKVLAFHLYDYDKFSRHSAIGEVEIDLSKVDVSNSVEMWCDIQRHRQIAGESGEVLISLSYLPAAERLTVVLMKAKDLKLTSTTPAAGKSAKIRFVRVSLMVEGKKVKRKKTSVRRGSVNPVWNEALAFNVPAEVLPKVTLEISVLDHDLIGHGDVLGRCILGAGRTGDELNHWNEMLT